MSTYNKILHNNSLKHAVLIHRMKPYEKLNRFLENCLVTFYSWSSEWDIYSTYMQEWVETLSMTKMWKNLKDVHLFSLQKHSRHRRCQETYLFHIISEEYIFQIRGDRVLGHVEIYLVEIRKKERGRQSDRDRDKYCLQWQALW